MRLFCETKAVPRTACDYVTATVLQFRPNAVIYYYTNTQENFSL